MKTRFNFIITLSAIALLSACGNSQPASDPHAGHNSEIGQGNSSQAESNTIRLKDDKLNAIYPHYVQLSKALVEGDVAEAKVAVNAIEVGMKAIDKATVLTTLAAKIGIATGIEEQRALFSELSSEFIARVKHAGLDPGVIYLAYCPMALNDKGSLWLSNEKEISNPYFGASMLNCGEVKETLNRNSSPGYR